MIASTLAVPRGSVGIDGRLRFQPCGLSTVVISPLGPGCNGFLTLTALRPAFSLFSLAFLFCVLPSQPAA